MKQALALYHVAFENLGSFASVLSEAAYTVSYRNAVHGLAGLDPKSPDLLIVLGGPIGVYEGDAYPFLEEERGRIAERLAAGLPTLGICLGAQLMAAALGAKVYPSGSKELGFSPLALTDAGTRSPLGQLAGVPVLHWHGDTFDIPAGGQLLASTDVCRNQAFAVGTHALALQFHPEADFPALEDWFVGHALELSTAKVDIRQLRATAVETVPKLREAGGRMLKAWLDGLAS